VPLYTTTGSDVLTPICFVDGNTAYAKYGVERKEGGPCPSCKASVGGTCFFNPTDSYYYFLCPICNKWFRWIDSSGKSCIQPISVAKATNLDEDKNLPNNGWW
jgi:hypothetical protein